MPFRKNQRRSSTLSPITKRSRLILISQVRMLIIWTRPPRISHHHPVKVLTATIISNHAWMSLRRQSNQSFWWSIRRSTTSVKIMSRSDSECHGRWVRCLRNSILPTPRCSSTKWSTGKMEAPSLKRTNCHHKSVARRPSWNSSSAILTPWHQRRISRKLTPIKR